MLFCSTTKYSFNYLTYQCGGANPVYYVNIRLYRIEAILNLVIEDEIVSRKVLEEEEKFGQDQRIFDEKFSPSPLNFNSFKVPIERRIAMQKFASSLHFLHFNLPNTHSY